MIARSLHRFLPLGSFFFAALAQAQPAPPAPAPAPAQPAAPQPDLAPDGRAPATGAPGTGAPVNPEPSATQSELEKRLAIMRGGAGLTSDEVARRSVANSYAIEAKRHALDAADAGIAQARAGFWPQLLLQARYTRLSEIEEPELGGGGGIVVTQNPAPTVRPVDPMEPLLATSFSFPVVLDQYSLQASLNIPLSDYLLRMSNAIGSAKHSRSSADFDARATRLSVAREGRTTYYEWVRTIGQQLVAAQTLEQTQGHYSDSQAAFQAGLVSKADVLRAEASVKEAQLLAERAKYNANLAEIRLRVLMRDTSTTPFMVGENLFADLPELERAPTAEAAYREALAKRPELRSLDAAEAALRSQAAVARAGNYPRLDAQANALYANPNQRFFPQQEEWNATWDVSVILSWTPTDIPGARSQADVANARAAEIRANRKQLEDALKVEVNQALQAVSEMRFAIGVTQHALAAAEESYRVRRELFRAGRATLVELTDAETELTRARIEVVNARVNSRLALVALNYALGRDTLR